MKNIKIIRGFLFILLGLLFIFFLFFIITRYQSQNYRPTEIKKITRVCFQENCFEVEIADNNFRRTQGLMYRKTLDENQGMLFIFDKEGIYSFWMKNTLIPLDIIWLDQEKKVVYIKKEVQPCKQLFCPSIKPDQSAKYVLEINAGLSDKINLKIGDKIKF